MSRIDSDDSYVGSPARISPFDGQGENPSPKRPRTSAYRCVERNAIAFAPGGILDSQTTETQWLDAQGVGVASHDPAGTAHGEPKVNSLMKWLEEEAALYESDDSLHESEQFSTCEDSQLPLTYYDEDDSQATLVEIDECIGNKSADGHESKRKLAPFPYISPLSSPIDLKKNALTVEKGKPKVVKDESPVKIGININPTLEVGSNGSSRIKPEFKIESDCKSENDVKPKIECDIKCKIEPAWKTKSTITTTSAPFAENVKPITRPKPRPVFKSENNVQLSPTLLARRRLFESRQSSSSAVWQRSHSPGPSDSQCLSCYAHERKFAELQGKHSQLSVRAAATGDDLHEIRRRSETLYTRIIRLHELLQANGIALPADLPEVLF